MQEGFSCARAAFVLLVIRAAEPLEDECAAGEGISLRRVLRDSGAGPQSLDSFGMSGCRVAFFFPAALSDAFQVRSAVCS